jgi:hypothetical protein
VSLCVPLSPSTTAATATSLHLIKASVSTSSCLLASIIVFLLHAHFCTLPKHPLLPHLPSCCSSHLHSACAPLRLITVFISASAFLLASLIDFLLHACHCASRYHPTSPHLSSYCLSHFPAMHAPPCFSTASISASSTLRLSPPPLFHMHTTASHESIHFHYLLITLFLWPLSCHVRHFALPQHPLLPPPPSCCSPHLPVTCVPPHIAIVSTPSFSATLLFTLLPCCMRAAAHCHSIHSHLPHPSVVFLASLPYAHHCISSQHPFPPPPFPLFL